MKKTDLKLVGIVTGGVLLAGFLMHQFQDVDLIDRVRNGYGG